MRSKVQATVLLLLAFNAYAVDDKSVVVTGEDSEMLQAVKQAQEGLDGFLALYSKPPPGASGFKLKVKFVGAGMTEYSTLLMVLAFAAAVAGALIGLPALLAPRRLTPVKAMPFECGKDPVAVSEGRGPHPRRGAGRQRLLVLPAGGFGHGGGLPGSFDGAGEVGQPAAQQADRRQDDQGQSQFVRDHDA